MALYPVVAAADYGDGKKDPSFSVCVVCLGCLTVIYKRLLLYIKGKAVPLQVWSGPENSRKLRFPDFMTTAQDGGKVVSLKHRPPLPPGNTPGAHFC